MSYRFGDPAYYGPGAPGFDYSSPVQTDYTDPATYVSGTYPGAGTLSSMPADQQPVIQISGANWVSDPPLVSATTPLAPSSPSDWLLPNFKKPSSLVPWAFALVALGGVAIWYGSSPPPRRRRARA